MGIHQPKNLPFWPLIEAELMLTEAALKSKKKKEKTTSPPILLNTVYRRPLQNYFFVLKCVRFMFNFTIFFCMYRYYQSLFHYPQTTSAFIQKYNGFYIVI